jgi:hypothetical protein
MLQTFSDTQHFILFYILIITQLFLNQIQNDTRRKIKQSHVVKIVAILSIFKKISVKLRLILGCQKIDS